MANKGNITYTKKEGYHYFDKEGTEIHDGDTIKWDNGKIEKVYLTDQGFLGTDATNPKWIESGRAVPCEYGIYPFETQDMQEITVVHK